MGFFQGSPVLSPVIPGAIWINAFPTHRVLLKIERERPGVLAAVGIIKVDWWLGCLRGIAELALTSKGQALHLGERWVFRDIEFERSRRRVVQRPLAAFEVDPAAADGRRRFHVPSSWAGPFSSMVLPSGSWK